MQKFWRLGFKMSMAALCISAWRGTEWSEALEAVMCLSVTNHKPHTDESELQPANTHISTSSPSNTPPELFILWPCGNFYLQVITQSETRPLIKGQHFLFDINHEKGKKKKRKPEVIFYLFATHILMTVLMTFTVVDQRKLKSNVLCVHF